MNTIQALINEHARKIEVLTSELGKREAAGERKIEKACKDHTRMLTVMQKEIKRHESEMLSLQTQLDKSTTLPTLSSS